MNSQNPQHHNSDSLALYEQMKQQLEEQMQNSSGAKSQRLDCLDGVQELPELLAALEEQRKQDASEPKVGDYYGPWQIITLHPQRTHRGERRWITKHQKTGKLKIFMTKGLRALAQNNTPINADEI